MLHNADICCGILNILLAEGCAKYLQWHVMSGAGLLEADLRRDVLGSELSFHMGIIQFTDERIGPGLASVHRDVVVILTVPFSPFCVAARHCNNQCLFKRLSACKCVGIQQTAFIF